MLILCIFFFVFYSIAKFLFNFPSELVLFSDIGFTHLVSRLLRRNKVKSITLSASITVLVEHLQYTGLNKISAFWTTVIFMVKLSGCLFSCLFQICLFCTRRISGSRFTHYRVQRRGSLPVSLALFTSTQAGWAENRSRPIVCPSAERSKLLPS